MIRRSARDEPFAPPAKPPSDRPQIPSGENPAPRSRPLTSFAELAELAANSPTAEEGEIDMTPAFRLSAAGWESLGDTPASATKPVPGSSPAAAAAGAFFGFSGDPDWNAKAEGYDPVGDRSDPTTNDEPAPAFKVRIGRLELTAPPPASPAPARRPPRPGPRLTLGDYLQRRKVGRS